jgi:hypothetical protein
VANNRYANAARRKRQEKTQKRSHCPSLPPPALASQFDELLDNLNWALTALRSATQSEIGRTILDRVARLATSACIIDGLTLDSEGWAALLNLANGRSFSALKNRRKIAPHKPGQTLMFSAANLLAGSAHPREPTSPKNLEEPPV